MMLVLLLSPFRRENLGAERLSFPRSHSMSGTVEADGLAQRSRY